MKIRTLFLFLITLLVVQTASSQVLISLIFGDKLNSDAVEFGLEGGFTYSDIAGFDADKRLRSFNLGFYFDIELKDAWRLYTGVLVKSKLGVRNLSEADLILLGLRLMRREGSTPSISIISWYLP